MVNDQEAEVVNVAEGLAREIARVSYGRKYYEEIGPSGQFGLLMMNQALERAIKASGSNDVVAVVRSYQELKDFKI